MTLGSPMPRGLWLGLDEAIEYSRPLPQWVKLRRTQYEHMSSGLLLKADIARCSRHFAFVPIADTLHCEREDMNFGFFVQQLAESTHLARRPLDPDRKNGRATSSQQRGRTI
jgi:hypothetical protein